MGVSPIISWEMGTSLADPVNLLFFFVADKFKYWYVFFVETMYIPDQIIFLFYLLAH